MCMKFCGNVISNLSLSAFLHCTFLIVVWLKLAGAPVDANSCARPTAAAQPAHTNLPRDVIFNKSAKIRPKKKTRRKRKQNRTHLKTIILKINGGYLRYSLGRIDLPYFYLFKNFGRKPVLILQMFFISHGSVFSFFWWNKLKKNRRLKSISFFICATKLLKIGCGALAAPPVLVTPTSPRLPTYLAKKKTK